MMLQHIAVTVSCAGMALVGQIPLSTLLAQTNTTPITSNEDMFWRFANTLGALGILAWYFYQTQTKTIPGKDAQITAERIASDTKLDSAIKAAAVEMQAERVANKAIVDSLLTEARAEREARMVIIRSCEQNRQSAQKPA